MTRLAILFPVGMYAGKWWMSDLIAEQWDQLSNWRYWIEPAPWIFWLSQLLNICQPHFTLGGGQPGPNKGENKYTHDQITICMLKCVKITICDIS
jgi:hypothetical protein